MTAFEITFRDKTIFVDSPFMATIFIYQSYGHYFIEVGGSETKSDELTLSHKWIDSKMKIGESVEISIIEENTCIPSKPIETKRAFSESEPTFKEEISEFHARMLDKFYTLQNFLKNEGMIT
ncbi:hypothetical protein [Sphingobacterium lumbrici]|uniref:hypothetical protein n=1 Tax=Sphingobacterium lumbrici TaxID=2559600 RepID=UPI00112C13E9|nr:hypothetical protein [Sphingobacterium lumbrici]